jgi:hypothetical protein
VANRLNLSEIENKFGTLSSELTAQDPDLELWSEATPKKLELGQNFQL